MGSGVEDTAEVLSHLQPQSHPPKKWEDTTRHTAGEGSVLDHPRTPSPQKARRDPALFPKSDQIRPQMPPTLR